MRKTLLLLAFSTLLLSGCRAIQPILVLKPGDLFWIPLVYIGLSYALSYVISKDKGKIWLWFTLNIILTPLFGIITIIRMLNK